MRCARPRPCPRRRPRTVIQNAEPRPHRRPTRQRGAIAHAMPADHAACVVFRVARRKRRLCCGACVAWAATPPGSCWACSLRRATLRRVRASVRTCSAALRLCGAVTETAPAHAHRSLGGGGGGAATACVTVMPGGGSIMAANVPGYRSVRSDGHWGTLFGRPKKPACGRLFSRPKKRADDFYSKSRP